MDGVLTAIGGHSGRICTSTYDLATDHEVVNNAMWTFYLFEQALFAIVSHRQHQLYLDNSDTRVQIEVLILEVRNNAKTRPVPIFVEASPLSKISEALLRFGCSGCSSSKSTSITGSPPNVAM